MTNTTQSNSESDVTMPLVHESGEPRALRLLVGLDVQSENDDALHEAFAYATLFKSSRIEILWVVPHTYYPLPTATAVAMPAPEDLLKDRVARIVEAFGRNKLVEAKAEVALLLAEGSAAERLEKTAFLNGADMIIVAASDEHKNKLEELLTGSVTRELVKNAPCPVLVMRPKLADAVPEVQAAPSPGQARRNLGMAHRYTGATRNQTAHENMPLLFPM